jgi:hypothetical protein
MLVLRIPVRTVKEQRFASRCASRFTHIFGVHFILSLGVFSSGVSTLVLSDSLRIVTYGLIVVIYLKPRRIRSDLLHFILGI